MNIVCAGGRGTYDYAYTLIKKEMQIKNSWLIWIIIEPHYQNFYDWDKKANVIL